MILTILVFLLLLSILVLIHELGHFLMAKKFGIKVEEFGYGFPPRVWGKKIGETLYSINLLPIGGFVKLFGEDEAGGGSLKITNPKSQITSGDLHRAFFAKPVWQRAAVVLAGVVMNALLAVAIYYGYFSISSFKTEIPLLTPHQFIGVTQRDVNLNKTDSVVTIVAPNSPAAAAGIKPPSAITEINGIAVSDRESLIKTINQNKGKEVRLTLRNITTNEVYSVTVVPRENPPTNEGPLGVGFFPMALLHYQTPSQQILSGIVHPINLVIYNFEVIGNLIRISIEQKTTEPISGGVAGPVGIYSLVGAIVDIPDVRERVLQVLNLAGILSISLAIFNILPIPALDGGRLFFILIEGASGRKVSPKTESLIHTVGFALLLTLIAATTLNDVSRIFRP